MNQQPTIPNASKRFIHACQKHTLYGRGTASLIVVMENARAAQPVNGPEGGRQFSWKVSLIDCSWYGVPIVSATEITEHRGIDIEADVVNAAVTEDRIESLCVR